VKSAKKKASAPLNADLRVIVGPLRLRNPLICASGTVGYGVELAELADTSELGGIIVKTVTLKPRLGNPAPRIAELPFGMLNSIGLENKGAEHFCEHVLPGLKRLKTAVIVSIAGEEPRDFATVAEMVSRSAGCAGVAALELNVSCPNVKAGGAVFGSCPKTTAEVVRLVRAKTKLPLITKLSPAVTDVVDIAQAATDAGSDAVSLINTFPAMAIDWRKRKSLIAMPTGGLSGPCIKPIALRMVWLVASKVKIPVIGGGGICTAADVLEFMVAGASAVQVGTMNFVDPCVCGSIAAELGRLLREQGVRRIGDIVGTLKA
jgi:dihydroorotate dehydrogenase (NAD+) catalytic subunit